MLLDWAYAIENELFVVRDTIMGYSFVWVVIIGQKR